MLSSAYRRMPGMARRRDQGRARDDRHAALLGHGLRDELDAARQQEREEDVLAAWRLEREEDVRMDQAAAIFFILRLNDP